MVPSSQTPAVWKQSSISRGAAIGGLVRRLVIRRQVRREPPDHVAVVAPGPVEDPVGGAVEVDLVDRLRADAAIRLAIIGRILLIRRLGRLSREHAHGR